MSYGGSHYNQSKSNLEKKGEGEDHYNGKKILSEIFKILGWTTFLEKEFRIKVNFNGEDFEYYHQYDFYAIKKHSNKLQTEIIIEVDGQEHYDDPQQIANDRKAEEYINFLKPDIYLIRLDKDWLTLISKKRFYKLKILEKIQAEIVKKYDRVLPNIEV